MAQHTIVTFVRTLGDHMVSTLNSLDGGALVVEPILPSASEGMLSYGGEAGRWVGNDPVDRTHCYDDGGDRFHMWECGQSDTACRAESRESARLERLAVADAESQERVRLARRFRSLFPDLSLFGAYQMALTMQQEMSVSDLRADEVRA